MAVDAWTETTVDEIKSPTPSALATGPFGSAISSKYFTSDGIPVIRGSNLARTLAFDLVDNDLVFLSEDRREFSRLVGAARLI